MIPTLRELRNQTTQWYCGNRVTYHHLPKCGGTSVVHALRWKYLPSYATFPTEAAYKALEAVHPAYDEDNIMNEVIKFREKTLLTLMYSDVRCIAGHVRVSQVALEQFKGHYNFITSLRDPASLLVSLYFYDRNHPLPRWRTQLPIEAYLETPRALTFASIYADFYCGLPPGSDMRSREAIDRAKRNLAEFAVIGLLDDMAGFQSRLRDILGIRLRIGHLNKAQVGRKDRHDVITADVRRKIEAMSDVNLEIYEYVRRHLT